jgi:Ras-related protein Rab-1A
LCRETSPTSMHQRHSIHVSQHVDWQIDLADKRIVHTSDAQKFADAQGMLFIETSAKDGTNVDDAFLIMADAVRHRMESSLANQQQGGKVDTTVVLTTGNTGKKRTCC